jgi:hypothetical protein
VTDWVNTQNYNAIEFSIAKPSDKCKGDCEDAYNTYRAVAHQLGYVPSPEEVLYMTADTEYSVPGEYDPAVRKYGQEGLARSFYDDEAGCGEDGICEGDELYHFLAGYQPWIGNSGQPLDEPTTPASRAGVLVNTLGSKKQWLWTDVGQILDNQGPGHTAYDLGWIKGWRNGHPAQWFGPFTPTQRCRNRVKPVYPYKNGNGTEFWILPPEEIGGYNAFCKP